MTLLEEILATGFNLAERDDGAIAAAVSAGRIKVVKYLGGIGTVLETLGPVDGAALLDQLEAVAATNSAVKWALVLVNRGELDFGSTAVRDMIDLLFGVSAPEVAAKLKALAVVPDLVSAQQVSQALEGYGDEHT